MMDSSPLTFGFWLRERRRQLDLTQEELADQLGCSRDLIKKIELGQRRPSRQMAELLAARLAVPDEQQADLLQFARRTWDLSKSVLIIPPASADRLSGNSPARSSPPNNLPAVVTQFIGREKELVALSSLMRSDCVRLVTLTGPGGTGKTRLALQVAAQLLDHERFPDGIFWEDLSALTDPSLVSSTIAQVFGISEIGGKTVVDGLNDYFRERALLLVLDNFEQVAEAAPLLQILLSSSAALTLLVTSRTKLHVYGEHSYPVPPMELPDTSSGSLSSVERLGQYEATRLFIERARLTAPNFALTNDNAPAIAEICIRLDGLPLAIELAASRVHLLAPQAMLARLGNRLKLLTGGAITLPYRQQTLRAAIEWSYDLLNDGEKQLFRRIAVFQGGSTFEAIEAACNYDGKLHLDVLDGVQSLMDKSLLVRREAKSGEPRFWMLETIHEYAREKLEESGEGDEVRAYHAAYLVALGEESDQNTHGPRQIEFLNRLEAEHDNARAALDWASSARAGDSPNRVEAGLKLIYSFADLWWTRGYLSEGREHARKMLEAEEAFQKTLGAPDNNLRFWRARAAFSAGTLARFQGDDLTAQSYYEEELAIAKDLADKHIMNWALVHLAMVSPLDQAEKYYEQALEFYRREGKRKAVGSILHEFGATVEEAGDHARARELIEEALVINREFGDMHLVALGLVHLGYGDYYLGKYEAARDHFKEALGLLRDIGDKRVISECLDGLGFVASAVEDGERAAQLFGSAEALRRITGIALYSAMANWIEAAMAEARAQVGEAAWQAAWKEGESMNMEQAIEYALQEDGFE